MIRQRRMQESNDVPIDLCIRVPSTLNHKKFLSEVGSGLNKSGGSTSLISIGFGFKKFARLFSGTLSAISFLCSFLLRTPKVLYFFHFMLMRPTLFFNMK